jgi:putative intracellular protease/amidase
MLTLDTLADWEIAYVTAELHSRRFFGKKETPCGIVKVGKDLTPVVSMGGMEIRPDIAVHDVEMKAIDFDDDDILILPGSDAWMNAEHDGVLNLAKKRIAEGKPVAAICGATAGLARVGALNEKKHTSNAMEYLKYSSAAYSGEARYVDAPAVSDGGLITASGQCPVDFTYEILKTLGVFRSETLEAWKNLYKTNKPEYFYALMNSLNPAS